MSIGQTVGGQRIAGDQFVERKIKSEGRVRPNPRNLQAAERPSREDQALSHFEARTGRGL